MDTPSSSSLLSKLTSKVISKTGLMVFGVLAVVLVPVLVLGILIYRDSKISVRDVSITNVTDSAFTVTWVSDKKYVGRVYYQEGNKSWPMLFAQSGKSVSYDDRDVELIDDGTYVQVDDGVKERYTHHVTIRNLKPETEYSFRVGGSINGKDAEIEQVKTLKIIQDIKTPEPGYGSVEGNLDDATDTLVYYSIENKDSGLFSTYLSSNKTYSIDMNVFSEKFKATDFLMLSIITKNHRYPAELNLIKYKPFDTIKINAEKSSSNLDNNLLSKSLANSCPGGFRQINCSCNDGQTACINKDKWDEFAAISGNCAKARAESIFNCIGESAGSLATPIESTVTVYNAPVTTQVKKVEGAACTIGQWEPNLGGCDGKGPENPLECKNCRGVGVCGLNEGICSNINSTPAGNTTSTTVVPTSIEGPVVGQEPVPVPTIAPTVTNIMYVSIYNPNSTVNCTAVSSSSGAYATIVDRCKNGGARMCYRASNGIEYFREATEGSVEQCKSTHQEVAVSPGDTNISENEIFVSNTTVNSYGQVTCVPAASYSRDEFQDKARFDQLNECSTSGVCIEDSPERKYFRETTSRSTNNCVASITPTNDLITVGNKNYNCNALKISNYRNGECRLMSNACAIDHEILKTIISSGFITAPNSEVGVYFYELLGINMDKCNEYRSQNVSLMDKLSTNKVSAQSATPRGEVLGAADQDSIDVEDSGRYVFFQDGEAIAEQDIIVGGDNVSVKLFTDTNGNGVKDASEKYFDDYSQIKIAKEASAESYTLNSGWNLINIPMVDTRSTSPIRSAGDLIDYWNKQGADIKHIARFTDGKFQMFSKRESGTEYSTDFQLLPGQAIFVLNLGQQKQVSFSGNKFEDGVPLNLQQGWNLVGIVAPGRSYTSETLIEKMEAAGVKADTVSQFENGLYKSQVKEEGTVFGNSFKILDKRGYFVRVDEGGGQKFTP